MEICYSPLPTQKGTPVPLEEGAAQAEMDDAQEPLTQEEINARFDNQRKRGLVQAARRLRQSVARVRPPARTSSSG